MRRSSLLVSTVVLAAAVSACAPGATPVEPEPAATTVDASAVNDALLAVADARAALDAPATAAVNVAVRIETIAAGLRSPSSVDATLDEVPPIVADAEAVDPAAMVQLRADLDAAIGGAEAALSAALVEVETGSWQERFLVSQQDVMASLRVWSAAHAQLDTLLAAHWDVWRAAVAEAGRLDHDRWLYRSPEEAAGTWEIAIADQLGAIGAAGAAVPPVVEALDAAVAAVRTADAAAAAVYADRPTAP